mmetsp:Transcript_23686/g.47214  ORF Transcript_23686/g.47214 Transcript_23686/m.47214 type:complete len:212 (-) Transcript_23686:21-656(-)
MSSSKLLYFSATFSMAQFSPSLIASTNAFERSSAETFSKYPSSISTFAASYPGVGLAGNCGGMYLTVIWIFPSAAVPTIFSFESSLSSAFFFWAISWAFLNMASWSIMPGWLAPPVGFEGSLFLEPKSLSSVDEKEGVRRAYCCCWGRVKPLVEVAAMIMVAIAFSLVMVAMCCNLLDEASFVMYGMSAAACAYITKLTSAVFIILSVDTV